MRNQFLNKELDFFNISKFRLITGILVGVYYSFALYSFLYLSREVFRILSVTEDYDMWILSDEEVSFYNLFFALISTIIAQSICFSHWLERPRSFFSRYNYKRQAIVNDQRILNWSFISWFTKLGAVFGIMFALAFHGGFYTISFYPEFIYLPFLIFIVLFLQTWITIRSTYRQISLKWMIIVFMILTAYSYGLSKINIIDYAALNKSYLKNNIYSNYRIELPETNCYEKYFYPTLIENLYVVRLKKDSVNKPIFIFENKETDLLKFKKSVVNKISNLNEFQIPNLIYRLHIDKSIKIEIINEVKNILSKAGVQKIAYAVIPKDREYDKRFYKEFSYITLIPYWDSGLINHKEVFESLNSHNNIIDINNQSFGTYSINKKPVEATKIKYTIKNMIIQNTDYVIRYHVNDSVNFADYFFIISTCREVIFELRDEYSYKKYNMKFDCLNEEEDMEVRKNIPYQFVEVTKEIQEIIDNYK